VTVLLTQVGDVRTASPPRSTAEIYEENESQVAASFVRTPSTKIRSHRSTAVAEPAWLTSAAIRSDSDTRT
jgi:hypothetical protein